MSLPIKTGFPDAIVCSSGYVIALAATDPTTGADVAGVVISNVSVFSDTGANITAELAGPFMWVPGAPQAV